MRIWGGNLFAPSKTPPACCCNGLRILTKNVSVMTTIHLGFDMGIRNLAYCLMRHDISGAWTIISWDNVDLLEGGVSSQDAKRCACGSPAVWIAAGPGSKWCKGCATGVRKKKSATASAPLPVLPCSLTVGPLKKLATEKGMSNAKKAKKEELISWATERYLMPWKPAKAMDSSLGSIRRAMDKWLDSVLPTFASATLIRLENQPVMKGPTMKSVQMILFTLLSHRLEKEHGWSGAIEFVHAGTKSRGVAATPAPAVDLSGAALAGAALTAAEGKAYRARKHAAEEEVVEHLTKAGAHASTWLTYFQAKSKKSDLADAFLMALRAA